MVLDRATALLAQLANLPITHGYANARTARNMFEETLIRQANRLADLPQPNDEQLTTILPEDVGPTVPSRGNLPDLT
jgi:hypothetical protein